MEFYGLDFGHYGAITGIEVDGERIIDIDILKFDKTNLIDKYDFIVKIKNAGNSVLVEHIKASWGDSIKSAFGLGVNVGRIQTLLSLAGVEYYYISPQRWSAFYRSLYGVTKKFKDNKERNKEWAKTLAPPRFYKYMEHTGVADSFLIAWFFKCHCDKIKAGVYDVTSKPKSKKDKPPKSMF